MCNFVTIDELSIVYLVMNKRISNRIDVCSHCSENASMVHNGHGLLLVSSLQGWGMVRKESPRLGPGKVMEHLAPWETFQVLGPHSGVDISDSVMIKRYVDLVKGG